MAERRQAAEAARGTQKWTEEQLAAIHYRGGNLLVAAAAGAGKTAVLVERIISYVVDPENPVDVDRLLVLTFTNAAAAEMRARVGRVLAERLDQAPGDRRLQRQMALLNHASIGTIHSFCLELIRQHFYLLGLDPGFRLTGETEAELLQAEVLETLFAQRYESEPPSPFHRLVDCYGGKRDDAALQQLVLEIFKLARSTPRPQAWLARLARAYALPEDAAFEQLPWCAALKQGLKIALPGLTGLLDTAIRLAGSGTGPGAYLDALEDDRAQIKKLVQALDDPQITWDDLAALLGGVTFGKLKAVRGQAVDPELKKQVADLRKEVKAQIKKIAATYFSRPSAELNADLRFVAPLAEELGRLTQDFAEAYTRVKRTRGLVDFSDLEHYCLEALAAPPTDQAETTAATDQTGLAALCPSAVAAELRQRYVEVLVDEYQDINPVQEAILNLVSRQNETAAPPNLFLVGDVKQSIYRFRLADPGLFLAKHHHYAAAPGAQGRRIELTKNFRSRRGVVAAVNYLFRQLMTPVVGELDYDPAAELAYGAGYPPAPPEGLPDPETVELYLCGEFFADEAAANGDDFSETAAALGEPDPEDLEILNTAQLEARLIAARIQELVGSARENSAGWPVYDPGRQAYRALDYRDIAVLLRSPAGWAQIFIDEFRALGVPAYAETSGGYFEATEVETMLSLLRVIDNPRQDIPLAGVLRSPLVGLDAEDLAQIRLRQRQGDFYEALCLAAEAGDPLAAKLAVFLERLDQWRDAAAQGELAGLLWRLYRDTGFYNYVGGLPGGAQRQANLRALLERTRQYEATGFRGLFLFLRYIERMQETRRDLGTAKILPEQANVVRLMSIHKSKGLEYPVVFIAGLGRNFNRRDLYQPVLLHKDLGLGLQYVDPELRITYPTVAKTALRHKLKMEALAEELRVLYVAMTRAKEKLILVGSVTRIKTKISQWGRSLASASEVLPDSDLAAASCFLDWIMTAVARHRDGFMLSETVLSDYRPTPAIAGDPSRWRLVFDDAVETVPKTEAAEPDLWPQVQRLAELEPSDAWEALVNQRLTWRYPYQALVGYSAKTTVTELKRRFSQIAETDGAPQPNPGLSFDQRPRFLRETTGLNAAEAGSALHLVMQNLDLRQVDNLAEINRQIAGMLARELLTPEQAQAAPARKILDFWQSPLGQRVRQGKKIYREKPFTLALPAGKIYSELVGAALETVLVQGVIDCLVEEGDGFLLLDYKTDRFAPARLEAVIDGYRSQLALYAGAVERIYGKKVKESYLYFINLALAVKV